MERKFVITGCIFIILGIIFGAFGAHGLRTMLEGTKDVAKKLNSFETGVRYQMYSGFTFLILGLVKEKFSFSFKRLYIIWLLGTIFFSFSIYLLSIQTLIGVQMKFLGPVTPLGGMLLIIGWFIFLLQFLRESNHLKS